MAKVKIGVIGCGAIANAAHIPSYMNCEDAEIKYFCDIVKEKADRQLRITNAVQRLRIIM